ncbi:MAG TPA: primosomal protein N', partial [Gemmatimonadales bacterium]
MSFVRVALPLPLFDPYTYRVPETLADRVRPGARVVVPVRRQEMVGIVVEAGAEAPAMEAKEILAVPDPEPAITEPLLGTADWIARYYGAPGGLVLRAMLPSGMWGRTTVLLHLEEPGRIGGTAGALLEWLAGRGGTGTVSAASRALRRPVWDVAERLTRVGAIRMSVQPPDTAASISTERVIALAGEPLTLLEREERFRRRPRQRALYETLEQVGGGLPSRHLEERLGFSDALVRALIASGLARVEASEVVRDPFAAEPATPPPGLPTADQRGAIDAIAALGPGTSALLFGVTGSGKTLVYLELIRQALAAGRGAILLVPEIGLTPQTVSRVRGVFGDQVAVLHSGLSDGERADAWRLLRRGERRVAVGARSAVFAPVRDLGIIVVDEEHEPSYKNGEMPRYHAREVAGVRAQLEGARLVLGSATPSLDTFGRIGPKLTRVDLPARILARPLPPVTLVDLRTAPLVRGTAGVPWSEALDQAIAVTLDRGEQVLLLLNRRGFASFLQCAS